MGYSNPAAYQRFMGRWSARLAPLFIHFAGVEDGQRVLDVGCGTGSLSAALLSVCTDIRVVGVDPVVEYVAFTRQDVRDHRAVFQTSAAEALPFATQSSILRLPFWSCRNWTTPDKHSSR